MYLLSQCNVITNFKLIDKLPGRSDKGKKRKLINTIKENPVEAVALGVGGLLALKYGRRGLKTAIRANKRINGKSNLEYIGNSGRIFKRGETLGRSIPLRTVPKNKIKKDKFIKLASAFLKGSGNAARKDYRKVKNVLNYAKTGKVSTPNSKK